MNRRLLAGLGLALFMALAPPTAFAVVVRRAVAVRPVAPVARVAVGTAAVIGTAAVVGSMVNTLPPSCQTVVTGNVTYQQCGSTWYQPSYSGGNVTYIVVNPPR